MSLDPRSRALRSLSSFLIAEAPLANTLEQILNIVTDAIPAAAYAGMTLLAEDGTATTAVFNDPSSPEIDAAQYTSGEGPCLDAWRRNEVIAIDDTSADTRYPAFTSAALGHGIRSTLSLPLRADSTAVGALNMYASETGAFTGESRELAEELAGVGGMLLANAEAYWGAYTLTEQLQSAMSSRAVIEQAKGILIAETAGLDADGAFEMLKAASQRENVKLREVALRIVEGRAT